MSLLEANLLKISVKKKKKVRKTSLKHLHYQRF